jgi:class 3 adenylate cyclase
MPERRIATVLMLDVVGSTHIAAQLGDARYRELSSRFNRLVRAALKRFGGKEEDHAGDGFFVTFTQPDRAIRFATTLADEVRGLGIEIRSGIHTGQTESQDRKTQGIAVVIGSRVMSLAGPGEILVTNTTKELVAGSDFGFEDFSAHELKGVPGTWQVFAVTSVDGEARMQPLPADEAAKRLGAVRPGTVPERRRRPARVAAGLAALVALAVAVFAVTRPDPVAPRSNASSTGPQSGSVVQIDQTGNVLVSIPAPGKRGGLGTPPGAPSHPMVVGQGGVWAIRSGRWLFHIDPRTRQVRDEITLSTPITFSRNVAAGYDEIWVGLSAGLIEIDPATGDQRYVHRIPPDEAQYQTDLAVGGGFVWLGTGAGVLIRFDPQSGDRRMVRVPSPIDVIGFGHGSVWTIDAFAGVISRYDPRTMERDAEIPLDGGTDNLVVGDNGVWVLSSGLGTLTRIDPSTNTVANSVPLGPTPTSLMAASGAIWVGDEDGIIRRVDEDTRLVTEIPFGAEIRALAFDEGTDTIWVDVA